MALIGYARISTTDQELDLQDDALRAAECTRIFVDRCSGATGERPGLAEALAFLREGDMLVVWKLDRLGRSMRNLVRTVEDLGRAGRRAAIANRTAGHPDAWRPSDLPHLRRPRAVRARPDTRADGRRLGRCPY